MPTRKIVTAVSLGLVLVLLVAAVILWDADPARLGGLSPQPRPTQGPRPPMEVSTLSGESPRANSGTDPIAPAGVQSQAPETFSAEQKAALSQIDDIQLMFRDFRTLMGENPVGTNAEIMKAIMGGNPRQATLGPPEGQSVNPQGELTDRWGTPYFFHQLSAEQMEVRSAGPDQALWTADDLVL